MTLAIESLEAMVYRCPIETPVVTSFGVMRDRPMVLVRVRDRDGVEGWGEVWCNYPSVGAEHRARIVDEILAPLLRSQPFADAQEAFAVLSERTAIMALQSGEPGPFAQCVAGIDIALWDLAARRAGLPLARMLGGTASEVAVYASGINPDGAARVAVAAREAGYRAFKLKVGFGRARDLANLSELRRELGDTAPIMADANQAWSLDEALDMAPALAPFGLRWLEEPIRADRPWPEWLRLAAIGIPLAGGENLAGEPAFEAAIASAALAVVQPDIAKWGGFSGNLPVVRRIAEAGLTYCPHWLGGGVGLLASAHLLAATGGNGALEVDANLNPLRTLTCATLARVHDGRATLPDHAGLGPPIDEAALQQFRVRH